MTNQTAAQTEAHATVQAAVPATAPENVFAKTPRFIVHVGPGLDRFHALPENHFKQALTTLAYNANYAAVPEEAYRWLSEVLVIAPEARRSEAATVLDVMGQFRRYRQKGGSLLTVVTFSQNVLSSVIDAMVQVRFHDELAVCYHPEQEGEVTVHRLNEDGVLQGWSFGAMHAFLGEDDLKELDFEGLTRFRELTR